MEFQLCKPIEVVNKSQSIKNDEEAANDTTDYDVYFIVYIN
jgi:hypothetical protein